MKYLLILIAMLLAAAPILAKAEDFTKMNGGLPAVFKRVGFRQSYYCAVVKISYSEPRVRDHIGQEFSLDDIGFYAVLKEFHINGAGGDGYPRLLKKTSMSLTQAAEEIQTNPDCGAGEKEISDADFREEFRLSLEKGIPAVATE